MVKKTPMYEVHKELNGKIVEFANYYLPIQYTSIIKEHEAVRNDVGIFDVSHMGEILIEGDALQFINYLVCNDVSKLKPGRIKYSPMLNENGGIIDDLLIYCFNENICLLVVNASNIEKDYSWIVSHKKFNVKISNQSDIYSQIALQGPRSKDLMKTLIDESLLPQKYYSFKESLNLLNSDVLVSKTGYTGEDGYEIYGDGEALKELFRYFISKGAVPCGLGARDTLRLEASMPLYSHEMNDEISPLDTSLEFFCKMNKEDFIGKNNLVDRGLTRIGIKNKGRGIIRENMELFLGEMKVGYTTSGTFLPTLKGSYAMAIVEKSVAEIGTDLICMIRGKEAEVEIVPLPFYKREKK